jgi:phospholipid/cholesterol/gamma-HCH transport system substrate-binding protein
MMETHARFILIGLFTLLGFIAGLGVLLWLAKVQINRTYAQYDIVFDTVAGLSETGAVRYNGVDVGKVLTIALDRSNPSLVRIRIEIYASTPVREDTVATLASQGVTGVAFIALAGGSAEAERLTTVPPAEVPVIRSESSAVQSLIADAPGLLVEAIALISEVRSFITPANREAVAQILTDLSDASGRIEVLVIRAEATLVAVEATLAETDAMLLAAQTGIGHADLILTDQAPVVMARLFDAADSAAVAMADIGRFARTDLPSLSERFGDLIEDVRGAFASINALANQIAGDPGRFLLGNQTPEYRRTQ